MKFIIYNDLYYLLGKRKGILSLMLVIPLLILLLVNIKNYEVGTDALISTMGGNLSEESTTIEVIMYIFSLSMSLFIVIDLYTKDYKNQLENIFLRMLPGQWYTNKSIAFIIMSILFKLLQYSLVCLLITLYMDGHIFNKTTTDFLITDILNTILIQFYFVFIYTAYCSWKKFKYLIGTALLAFTILIPKNILFLSDYKLYLFIIIILINFINLFMHKNKTRNIIQNMGGIL